MRLLPLVPLLFVAMLVPGPVLAADSYDSCKGFIDTLPAVLTVQGTWCLNKDLVISQSSGAAITISGNNIAIDCNGYKLGGLGAGKGTFAYGIEESERLNATVRDCVIRGFHSGIRFVGGGGHLLEDNRLDGNTVYGIYVDSENSTIRRNLVLDTGGSIPEPNAWGIRTVGLNDVLDNTIAGVSGKFGGMNTAIGLYMSYPGLSTVANNRIRGIFSMPDSLMYGILLEYAGYTVIRDNSVGGPEIAGARGIACFYGNQGSSTGNVVVGFENGMTGCTSTGDVVKDTEI